MTSLYSLSKQFHEIQSFADSDDPEAMQAVRDTIAGMSGEAGDIIEEACKYIANIKANQDAIEAEIDRLAARKKSLAGSIANVRGSIMQVMTLGGFKTMRTALFSVTVAEGSKSVDIINQDELPDAFVVVKTEIVPDKKAIRAALDAGQEVPGATIKTGEKSLRIK